MCESLEKSEAGCRGSQSERDHQLGCGRTEKKAKAKNELLSMAVLMWRGKARGGLRGEYEGCGKEGGMRNEMP